MTVPWTLLEEKMVVVKVIEVEDEVIELVEEAIQVKAIVVGGE